LPYYPAISLQVICPTEVSNIELPHNPEIPLIGIEPRELKTHVYIKT